MSTECLPRHIQGVSPETASKISKAVGLGNEGLEMLQVDELMDGLKVVNKMDNVPGVKSALMQALGKMIKGTASETAQEVMQEGVTIAGSNLGRSLEGIQTDDKKSFK